jgi:hypothetical protein
MKTLVRLRCRDCGYGVSARSIPESCPMCHGSAWEHEPWRPFSALLDDLHARRGVGTEAQRLPK